MSDKKITNDLLFEVLKRIQKSISDIEEDGKEIKSRLINLETGMAGLRRDNSGLYEDSATQHARYDRLLERIVQLEKRLDISD